MSTSKFEAVLFDLDGTLLDTTEAILESFKHTIHHFTGRIPAEEEIRPYMGLPLRDQFSIFLPGNEDEACKVYVEHNLSIHKDRVRPFPGVQETLDALRENGVITALVTSKRRETANHGLYIAGIENMFDAMVFYDDTKEHKPHPAPIIKAITDVADRKHSNTPTKEMHVLFVGDSPTDIDATKNAQSALKDLSNQWDHRICSERLQDLGNIRPFKNSMPHIVIESAGVTYGAYPEEVIQKAHPDYILTNITQVLELCGLGLRKTISPG